LRVKMPQHTQEVQVAMQEEEKVSESAGAWISPLSKIPACRLTLEP
jgi:hypothetical protein